MNKQGKKINVWLPYIIIIITVLQVYLPTLTGEFILDDGPLVKKNTFITEVHPFFSYLLKEDGQGTGYYRPLINLSYFIDYKIWGMNAPGFRITNLILHILSCFALFNLLTLLVHERTAVLCVTIIFALHPVNTEAVSWVTSRNNLLVTLFGLVSFYSYFKAYEKDRLCWYIVSFLFFGAALLSKEFGIMLLPIYFLYHRILNKKSNNFLKEFVGYLPFILIIVLYFLIRQNATGSLLTPAELSKILSRIIYFPYLLFNNLKLIILPFYLHSFIIHYPDRLFNTWTVTCILFFIISVILIWKKRQYKLLIFSVSSFVMTLFPVSNIIPTSAVSLISMRWLYFPMSFLIIMVAFFFEIFLQRKMHLTLAVFGVIIIYLGFYSYLLNKNLWHNEEKFFEQEVLNLGNTFYNDGFARILLDKNELSLAEKYFLASFNNNIHRAADYIDYSYILIETNRPSEAILYLQKTKSLYMTFEQYGQRFNNLGMAYFKLNQTENALKNFRKAVIYNPGEARFWANLGGAYGSMGNYREAINALKRGLELAPESIQIKKNLTLTYIKMGEYQRAISLINEIPAQEKLAFEIERLLKEVKQNLEANKGGEIVSPDE